jgi:hypothetical protein
MFLACPSRPILAPLPPSFKHLPVHCDRRHWSVRSRFAGFVPTTRFSHLRVPPQMGAIFECPACHARELVGADFSTGQPYHLGHI